MLFSLEDIHHLCVEYSIVIALLFIFLVWYLDKKFGFKFMETSLGNNQETNYCDDENCVRCNKYIETSLKAVNFLASIKDTVIASRIQKGLDNAKTPVNENDPQKPNVFYYEQLAAVSIWDGKPKQRLAKDCKVLENMHHVILEEYSKVLEDQTCGVWKKNRTPYGSWDVFHLINQGVVIAENTTLCPETNKIINLLSSVMKDNVFGNVMFSVLKPGTHISPHFGPTNIRLRCHIGLRTTPHCSLTVDGVSTSWEDGKCIVFDDSFLHSVNYPEESSSDNQQSSQEKLVIDDSGQSRDRVVLIVDLWHPDLAMEERDAINMCFRP